MLRDYQKEHPIAMRSLNDDLETCLAYLRPPLAHQNRKELTGPLD